MRTGLQKFGGPVLLYLLTLIGENLLDSTAYAWVWDWLPLVAVVWAVLAAISYSDRIWGILFGWLPTLKIEWPKARLAAEADVSNTPNPTLDMLESDRRRTVAKREWLLMDWRKMVTDVHASSTADPSKRVLAHLEAHPSFPSILPLLNASESWRRRGRIVTARSPESTTLPDELMLVLDVIADKEKEWKLL